jgi:hypothetical protein
LKRICVFCGSSPGNNFKYAKSARKLGETLTECDITLIYGGSNIGLLDKIINFSPPQIDKWWVDRKKDKRSEVQKLRVQGLEK